MLITLIRLMTRDREKLLLRDFYFVMDCDVKGGGGEGESDGEGGEGESDGEGGEGEGRCW